MVEDTSGNSLIQLAIAIAAFRAMSTNGGLQLSRRIVDDANDEGGVRRRRIKLVHVGRATLPDMRGDWYGGHDDNWHGTQIERGAL